MATETELIERARHGDREALDAIVRANQEVVRRYVAKIAPDPFTADDLAQDVFLAALRQIKHVDPSLGIRPYLLAIARNMARQAWRESRVRGEVSGDAIFDTVVSQCLENEPAAYSVQYLTALQQCLKRLAPRALEIILHHYRDEQRCDEIAQQFGIAVGTVHSTLTRARQALRECIEPKIVGAMT